jgi:plastocyanin
MKKLIFIIPLIVLLAGCTSTATNTNNNTTTTTPQTTASDNVVTYTDTGFSPATITINKGDTVTFENIASNDVWVASNPHPQHNGYPTTGGCIGSTFDACGNISPNNSWSFKFDITGSWGYHNHLNHTEGGTVIVK